MTNEDRPAGQERPILEKVKSFTATLDRQDFYDFYGLMTALASPACGDYLPTSGGLLNLKKIIRRLRITVMSPRFNVDYAEAYTEAEARKNCVRLTEIYKELTSASERNAVAKVIGALQIISRPQPESAKETES